MSNQRLGAMKHKICEGITGRKYNACYVTKRNGITVAECVYRENGARKVDVVNYGRNTGSKAS